MVLEKIKEHSGKIIIVANAIVLAYLLGLIREDVTLLGQPFKTIAAVLLGLALIIFMQSYNTGSRHLNVNFERTTPARNIGNDSFRKDVAKQRGNTATPSKGFVDDFKKVR